MNGQGKTLLLLVPLLAAATLAAATDDNQLRLGYDEPLRTLTHGAGYVSQHVLYPLATFATSNGLGQVSDDVERDYGGYRLHRVTAGAILSEQREDFALGQFLSELPAENPDDIDWVATRAAILDSAGYREGRVTYIDSETDPRRRILFTGGGSVEIAWKFDAGSAAAAKYGASYAKVYNIARASSARPFKLFWTEPPFNAPAINLSGKHVRIFGKSSIVEPQWEIVAGGATSNVIRGVVFDNNSQTLRAYCKVRNVALQDYDGPEGQFVLAYYESGDMKKFVGSVVVEVSGPSVKTLQCHVGDELHPDGSGWNADGLRAYVQQGDQQVEGDDNSPYLYGFDYTDERTDAAGRAIYAIAPTDASTTTTGRSAPWRADVYWQIPDMMDTLWPFEEDWYEITWNPDDPRVVFDPDNRLPDTAGIHIPTNYTVEVCAYQSPAGTVAVTGNALQVRKGGRFTLKLMEGTGKLWFMPMIATDRSDPAVMNAENPTADAVVSVGDLIGALPVASGGTAAVQYGRVDEMLSGYINAPRSAGRNWNYWCYHDPETPKDASASMSDDLSRAQDATNAFERFQALASTIWAVSASTDPIEVWWRGTSVPSGSHFTAPGSLTYPTAVQRYAVRAPSRAELREIVLASERGSSGMGLEKSAASLCFVTNSASVSLLSERDSLDLDEQPYTMTLMVNPSPGSAFSPPVRAGRLLTLRNDVAMFALETTGNEDGAGLPVFDFSLTTNGVTESWLFSCPTNEWSMLAWTFGPKADDSVGTRPFVLYRNGEEIARRELPNGLAGRLAGGYFSEITFGAYRDDAAATGVGIDRFAVYGEAYGAEAQREYFTRSGDSVDLDAHCVLEWNFEPDGFRAESGSGRIVISSSVGAHRLVAEQELLKSVNCPGAPERLDGGVPCVDGIVPEVYRQCDRTLPGYHPNLAHAFVRSDDGQETYVTWAMRNDLSDDPGDSIVFTVYNAGGRAAMRTCTVVATNGYYRDFRSAAVVGHQLLPPKPFSLLDDYWTDQTTWASLKANAGDDKSIVYRDRKLNDWARRDGGGYAFYHYKLRDDFDFPTDVRPDVGTYVPWMNFMGTAYDARKLLELQPAPWYWSVSWPAPDTVPVMKVAQTLTKAQDQLPEVWNMASCAVVYPMPGTSGNVLGATRRKDVVTLVDPTVAQTAALDIGDDFVKKFGFSLGNSGNCQLRKGKYYFTGLPPSVADRFYVDVNADPSQRMVLVGNLVEPAAGNAYLQLNVLMPQERQAICDICKAGAPGKDAWDKAVKELAKACVCPSDATKTNGMWRACEPWTGDVRVVTNVLSRLDALEAGHDSVTNLFTSVVTSVCETAGAFVTWDRANRPVYSPVDHYALMATGNDAGFVVLVENDSDREDMVSPGDPVDLKVIRVVPELYCGTISTLTDPLNKLSEMLTVQYNEPFGDASTNYVFKWNRTSPNADGSVNENRETWDRYAEEAGLTSFVLGTKGTKLTELVNNYYSMRYWPREGTPAHLTVGGDPSRWTDYTLAEGWVQRVLNSVTPFAQRVEDFRNNPADIWYTMFEQIGGPYRGDVALNNANLTEVGLLELYQTVFNKAEKMSLALGVENIDVDKQLLLAASRIADFHLLLGAEAYSDAKNPLVSVGFDDVADRLKEVPSSTFCFQNQVPTLLDEELALLRGRTIATQAPNMTTAPYYNRLVWNFTKGITEGEVAYVNNYGIRAEDGVLTVDQAAKQYPQGHGDAWGHYLSAITGYYRLLRNPHFTWTASMMEMLVSQAVVNNDDTDEQKFADAAVKLARTGLDVIDLTARKAWRDNSGAMTSAYFDTATKTYGKANEIKVVQGFGYGEWAARTGLGGIYNWAVVNSLLTTNDAPAAVYADQGLKHITRTTASQLNELCDVVGEVQERVNRIDSGLNPLGLSQNAVPMDIDPTALAAKNSHFDQIVERAEKALANCEKVLDYAQQHGARLRQIQNLETAQVESQGAAELDFKNRLIAVYGTPFPGDIGPTGTYPQGYDGPDLFNYDYMDLGPYGLEKAGAKTFTCKLDYNKIKTLRAYIGFVGFAKGTTYSPDTTVSLTYATLANGIRVKPAGVTGTRATEGSIQAAYRDFLSAFVAAQQAEWSLNLALERLDSKRWVSAGLIGAAEAFAAVYLATTVKSAVGEDLSFVCKRALNRLELVGEAALETKESVSQSVPGEMGAGLTVITDPRALANAALSAPYVAGASVRGQATATLKNAILGEELAAKKLASFVDMIKVDLQIVSFISGQVTELTDKIDTANACADAYRNAIAALAKAEAAYRQEVYKGDMLLDELEGYRKAQSDTATRNRYADMFYRVQRNAALTKYSTAFDTAQRYVWELAKVYDYETGLLSSDSQAADRFYGEIVGSRLLGRSGVTTSQATDRGLYDIVNRMKENWSVLKGRLGVNNPDNAAKWFSLRYSLFRIKPDAAGDVAWKDELSKYVVDDIFANGEVARHCQPPAGRTAAVKEPGLVIPFATSINNAENFFGKTLQGGESQFSSSDYATKINAIGVDFNGYDALTVQSADGLATEPNVYLVPVGRDYMRAPAGTDRRTIAFSVVDQVLPLPYAVGSTELDDVNWISTFSGFDGTSDSAATIRRHSTLRAGPEIASTRLVGRSVWNDRWLLVIPAASLNADREKGLKTFLSGVKDIRLGIKAYSRHGN